MFTTPTTRLPRSDPTPTSTTTIGPRWRPRVLAVMAATVVAVSVWALARSVSDLTVHVGSGPHIGHVGPASVIAVTVLVGLAGWGLLALLERRMAHPRAFWTVVALVALAASMVGPLSAGIGGATKAALTYMHIAVAGVLIPAFARTATRR
jgi:hypothetical protein